MEILDQLETELPPGASNRSSAVVSGRNPRSLAAIRRKHVSLAIWSRTVPELLCRFLDSLPESSLPNERFLVYSDDARATIIAYLNETLPYGFEGRTLFIDDVCALVDLFQRTTGSRRMLIRLEAVTDDSCRKFHADAVGVRLLSTYRGPGTQWLLVDPRTCSNPRPCPGSNIQWETTDIRQLPRFAVGMFKGLADPAGGAPAIHRSPPIAGTGTTRLLLAVDDATTGPWSNDSLSAPIARVPLPQERALKRWRR